MIHTVAEAQVLATKALAAARARERFLLRERIRHANEAFSAAQERKAHIEAGVHEEKAHVATEAPVTVEDDDDETEDEDEDDDDVIMLPAAEPVQFLSEARRLAGQGHPKRVKKSRIKISSCESTWRPPPFE